MSAPSFATVWSAVVHGTYGPYAVGDALLYYPAIGYWVVATATNRALVGGRSEGVALEAFGGSGASSVQVQVAGLLDTEISGLGAGAQDEAVRVSTAGRLERVASPGGSDDIVGTAQANGRVFLGLGSSVKSVGGTSLALNLPMYFMGLTTFNDTGQPTAECSLANSGAVVFGQQAVYPVGADSTVSKMGFLSSPYLFGGAPDPADRITIKLFKNGVAVSGAVVDIAYPILGDYSLHTAAFSPVTFVTGDCLCVACEVYLNQYVISGYLA